jgi:hypothetical protein
LSFQYILITINLSFQYILIRINLSFQYILIRINLSLQYIPIRINVSLQYTLSLTRFLTENLEIHTLMDNIINKLQLHKLSTTLTIYHVEHYDSIKIFNKLNKYTAESVFRKKYFISNLKWYSMAKAFYSIEG